MIDLEDRLRRDLIRASELAQPDLIRPLRVPSATRPARVLRWLARTNPRSGTARWLAPVTAILVVVAIAAAAVLAGRPSRAPSSTPAGMPKYYVTLGRAGQDVSVTVRASLNGAPRDVELIPRFRGQAGYPFTWVTAAANDRVFAIGVELHVWILRLAADGGVQQFTRLPDTLFTGKPMITSEPGPLSPAGNEIAFGLSNPQGVAVVSLTTGAVRTWLTGHQGTDFPARWIGDEINVDTRLLDVAGPGGNLLADSRPLRIPLSQPGWTQWSAELVTDQKVFLVAEWRTKPHQTCRLVEISARTFKLQRVLYSASATRQSVDQQAGCSIVSQAPTGLNALIDDFGLGRLDGAHFTPLPGRAVDPMGQGNQAAW